MENGNGIRSLVVGTGVIFKITTGVGEIVCLCRYLGLFGANYTFLLQNILSFIGLFRKRDLSGVGEIASLC